MTTRPHAFVSDRDATLLCVYVTDIGSADSDGNSAQTSAAFAAAPHGTEDCGDSANTAADSDGGWTYTLRLPSALHGGARSAVERRVTRAVRAV